MSDDEDPDRAALAQAKSELIAAAGAIDPLAPLRKQPLISMGVAAGIGAILAMSEEGFFSKANLDRVLSLLERTAGLAVAAERMIRPAEPRGADRTC